MQKVALLLMVLFLCGCTTDKENGQQQIEINTTIPVEPSPASEPINPKDSIEDMVTVSETTLPDKETVVDTEPEKVDAPKPAPKPILYSSIHFDASEFQFGRVKEGDIVKHTFTFTNKGNADLIIKDVLVDCGCTAPDYTKKPIAPGASEKIDITFDTKGKIAAQERIITVLTNGKPVSKILRLKGIVDTE